MTTATIRGASSAVAAGRRAAADVQATVVPSATRVSVALAVLRAIVGVVFLAHGGQKLFVYGFEGVTGAFAGMGIPLPGIAGPAVALTEFLGGLLLVLGAFTPFAAAALAAVMLGAIVMVHVPAGFFAPNGFEFPLTLFAAAVTLGVAGPGRYSVDRLLARRRGARG